MPPCSFVILHSIPRQNITKYSDVKKKSCGLTSCGNFPSFLADTKYWMVVTHLTFGNDFLDLYFIKTFSLLSFPLNVELPCSGFATLKLLYTSSKNASFSALFHAFSASTYPFWCGISGIQECVIMRFVRWLSFLTAFRVLWWSGVLSLSTQRMASQNSPQWHSHPFPKW